MTTSEDLTLEQWIEKTATRRESLMAYGSTGKAGTAEGRALDSLVAIGMADEAARIEAEADSYLTLAREQAMWETRKKHPDLTSRERDLVEKSIVREVVLLVKSCEITYKSCLSRYFEYKGH